MTGRAVTPEAKRAIVERLLAAWLRMPELRFGQMLTAAADRAERDTFYIEDEALCEAVEALAKGEFLGPPEPLYSLDRDFIDDWWAKRERPPERADDVAPEEVSAEIVLTHAERERIRELCENPPEPTETLRRLMRGEQK